MRISPETDTYIAAVAQFSGNQLQHPDDCALLVEASALQAKEHVLDDLCFTAKFLHRTFLILQRIGVDGEGYGALSAEFESNLSKARDMMEQIAAVMPDEDRTDFAARYLALSAPAFASMLELLHDLYWMKNYSLDGKARS